MKVTVEFHPNDDLSPENRKNILEAVLDTDEAATAVWDDRTLTYTTQKEAYDVIFDWTYDGYNIDEFVSFKFEGGH